LFGWSFYQLGDKNSTGTSCTNYRPIEWSNGDYCGWKVWPNSVIRLASSAISLTVALITTYAVVKDIRFALILVHAPSLLDFFFVVSLFEQPLDLRTH